MKQKETIILGIETSCDDTSAAICKNDTILSNVISNQEVHNQYGGVVPELASRAHQQNIIPVVDKAIKDAGISVNNINAVAFTGGPGLIGALLVGSSFAKGFSLAKNIPLIEVDHLQAHVLAHFIKETSEWHKSPLFPFLCLLVSGGNSQIIIVEDYFNMKVIGQTIDDAAGEAYDKCAKIMGLPYPGGPVIDKFSIYGSPNAFKFSKPKVDNLNFSFSGLKTAFLYTVRDKIKEDAQFIKNNLFDLCSSIQFTINDILIEKLVIAAKSTNINRLAISGGVSANSALRSQLTEKANKLGYELFFTKPKFSTDNAAMVAIAGYFKYRKKKFAEQNCTPYARNII